MSDEIESNLPESFFHSLKSDKILLSNLLERAKSTFRQYDPDGKYPKTICHCCKAQRSTRECILLEGVITICLYFLEKNCSENIISKAPLCTRCSSNEKVTLINNYEQFCWWCYKCKVKV